MMNSLPSLLPSFPPLPQLDSTWIVLNQPSDEDTGAEFAGFLMALGLNWNLTSLSDYHLYSLLQEKHNLTVIGLLVGVAAAR